jgi:hypothetical protein
MAPGPGGFSPAIRARKARSRARLASEGARRTRAESRAHRSWRAVACPWPSLASAARCRSRAVSSATGAASCAAHSRDRDASGASRPSGALYGTTPTGTVATEAAMKGIPHRGGDGEVAAGEGDVVINVVIKGTEGDQAEGKATEGLDEPVPVKPGGTGTRQGAQKILRLWPKRRRFAGCGRTRKRRVGKGQSAEVASRVGPKPRQPMPPSATAPGAARMGGPPPQPAFSRGGQMVLELLDRPSDIRRPWEPLLPRTPCGAAGEYGPVLLHRDVEPCRLP